MAKKDYDSKFCGSLPIQFINQVQDYGFLVITDLNLNMSQVSENIADFIGVLPEACIGRPLGLILEEFSDKSFPARQLQEGKSRFVQKVSLKGARGPLGFTAICYAKDDHLLMEFEPEQGMSQVNFQEVYQRIQEASVAIQQAGDLRQALETAAHQIKLFSGFDKVMIYQFDEQWNGHVLAEVMEPGMESYLGNTFPASDIPKQARELYLKNPYRLIPDRNYKPSRLFPVINPLKSGFIDLSDCNVRAVAKVHIEYLKNMNVMCSMSARIIKDGQLWGLIACHHREAKFLSYEECSLFELLSSHISSKISSAAMADMLAEQTRLQAVQTRLIDKFYSTSNLLASISLCAGDLMQILNCQGLVHAENGKLNSFGTTPGAADIHELIIWLETKSGGQPYVTAQLSADFEDGEKFSELAAGLVAFPINPLKGEFLLLFRPEILQTIDWGGNPNQAIHFEEDMKTYHPRHSFVVWQEQVRHSSQPFSAYEMHFINDFQKILAEFKIRELQ